MSKEYLNNDLRTELLDTAIVSGDFILASGKPARQKFDFDLVHSDTGVYREVMKGLARCIDDNFHDYSGIITVANGATRLGEPLSEMLGVQHITTSYRSDQYGNKLFSVDPIGSIHKAVIVDDVFTSGTNATKVALAARQHDIETIGLAVVLDRSQHVSPSIMGGVAVASIVQHTLS